MKTRHYLICYDIRDSKRLQRVHKVVIGFAHPVQRSVYFALLTKLDLKQLLSLLSEIIDENTDDIRIYPAPALNQAEMLGANRTAQVLQQLVHFIPDA